MILDQYGSPYRYGQPFANGANRSTLRGPQYPNWDNDIEKLIPPFDRKTLVVLAKRLFTNFGVLKAIVTQKADYSIGEAWMPDYMGQDQEAGEEVEAWFRNVWFPNCDVRGGIWNWHRELEMVSHDIDFGDSYTLLTTTEDGTFPLIQPIASWRVDSCGDQDTVSSGDYEGETIHDGHIYNASGRVIAYRVKNSKDDPKDYKDIPARSIVHVYDPDFEEQGRGYPSSTHALEDLKHCLQSTEFERIRQMIISSIGLIEHNEMGGPDLDDPAFAFTQSANDSCTGITYEDVKGGAIRYFKANSGAKLEQIKHESPGDMWENFHDRLLRNSIIGASWSYAMVWKPTGQGTAERADVLRARRAIAKRQSLLKMWARRVVSYAYSVAFQNEKVVELDRPTAWDFTHPPQLTVDDGREQRSIIEAWRAGILNKTQVVEALGRTIGEHERERARETVLRKQIAREESRDGITVTDEEMAMLTPNGEPVSSDPETPEA